MKIALSFCLTGLLIILLMVSSCSKAPVNKLASGNSENLQAPDIPAPERMRKYDVRHITIKVQFDWNERKVTGEVETMIVPLTDQFREFDVDAVGFNISSVRDKSNADMKYEYNGKQIKIDPGKINSVKDTIIYTVNYTCQPQKGLYFIYPTELNPSMPYQIWTQGAQNDNRYWIPLYDYPNDKTTFEVYMTVDNKYKTLSNGYLDFSKNISGTNDRQDHWVMDKPNSTYLIMLATGEFNISDDTYGKLPVQSYTDRNVSLSDAVYSFRNTPEMIKVFEKKYRCKYPWNKYAQAVVEDFLYGGMENTSAALLNKNAVYDKVSETAYSSDGLISHELSHQWWGDLVTCSNWSEIWLNESFGEYSTALWAEHYSGRDEYDYEIFRNGQTAVNAESSKGVLPVWSGFGRVEENIYEKGSVILNTFRYVLGDTIFFRSLGNLLNEFSYKNIVTQDFLNVINATYNASNNSNENFRWMFDQWIWKAGYPKFKVEYSYEDNKKQVVLNVKQVQTVDTLVPVFRTPVDIRLKNSSEDRIEKIEIKDNDETFYFNSKTKPELVVFDNGNKIPDKTIFDKTIEEWKLQFELSESAVDRISALYGAEVFLKEDTSSADGKPVINYGQIMALKLFSDALQKDSFWGVRNEAVKILSENFTSDRTGAILKEAYDLQTDPRIKGAILAAFGNSKRSEDIDFVKAKIQNETDDFILFTGISALGIILPAEEVYDAVIPFSGKISHGNVVQYAVIASLRKAAKTGDIRIKKVLLDFAFGKDIEDRLRESAIYALKKFAGDDDVTALSIKYADNSFIFVKSALIYILGASNDKSVIPFLESMNQETNDESMNKLISSSIKKLQSSN